MPVKCQRLISLTVRDHVIANPSLSVELYHHNQNTLNNLSSSISMYFEFTWFENRMKIESKNKVASGILSNEYNLILHIDRLMFILSLEMLSQLDTNNNTNN